MSKKTETSLEIIASGFDLVLSIAGGVAPVAAINSVRKFMQEKETEQAQKNITAFLKEAATNSSKEQSIKFLQTMSDDEAKTFIEDVIFAVGKMEKEEKAKVLGKLYAAVESGELTKKEFMRLVKVVELIYIETLEFYLSMNNTFDVSALDNEQLQRYNELIGLGLGEQKIQIDPDPMSSIMPNISSTSPYLSGGSGKDKTPAPKLIAKTTYSLSHLGVLFFNIMTYGKANPSRTDISETKKGRGNQRIKFTKKPLH